MMKKIVLMFLGGLIILSTTQMLGKIEQISLKDEGLNTVMKSSVSLRSMQELSGLIRVLGKRFSVEIDLKNCEAKFIKRKKELKEASVKFIKNNSILMIWEETSPMDESKSYDFMMIITVGKKKVLCSSNANMIMDGTPTVFTKKEIDIMIKAIRSMKR